MMIQGNPAAVPDTKPNARCVGMTIDSDISVATGFKGQIQVPFAGNIFKWTLLADTAGDIVVDVLKDSYEDYPPFAGTSIAGTELPMLSGVAKNQDEELTSWNTQVNAGDLVGFYVNSVTTVKKVTLILWIYE